MVLQQKKKKMKWKKNGVKKKKKIPVDHSKNKKQKVFKTADRTTVELKFCKS